MKIIINTTNLKLGGALQVARSFIYECINIPSNEYHVFLSPALEKEVCRDYFPSNFIFYSFDNPSVFIVFCQVIKALKKAESKINPDCVFSVFGPTYWQPKSIHIMGFANALYLYRELPYIKNMPFFQKVRLNLKRQYHRKLLKKNADFYILQTNSMKKNFLKFIKKPDNVADIVPGQYDSIYEKRIVSYDILPEKKEFWLVSISAFYPHKRLQVINDLIPKIKEKNLKIKFILTISEKDFEMNFSHNREFIINLGPLELKKCPFVYSKSDALFLPTLIESYSASYPEAMKMKLPILTSDYPFARDVCHDAALYFDPFDNEDIMNKIEIVYHNKSIRERKIKNGLIVVNSIPSAKDRAEKYLNLCKDYLNNV